MKLLEIGIPVLKHLRGPGATDLADQIARAMDSIHSNIAEGHAKGFSADNCRYLRIAMASANEVETRLEGAIRSGRLPESAGRPVVEQARRVRALIAGFIKHVTDRAAAKSRKPSS